MHRFHHLVKPKHELRWDGKMFRRSFAGFYEERDVHGTFVHWTWLLAHWHWAADLEQAREKRRKQQ